MCAKPSIYCHMSNWTWLIWCLQPWKTCTRLAWTTLTACLPVCADRAEPICYWKRFHAESCIFLQKSEVHGVPMLELTQQSCWGTIKVLSAGPSSWEGEKTPRRTCTGFERASLSCRCVFNIIAEIRLTDAEAVYMAVCQSLALGNVQAEIGKYSTDVPAKARPVLQSQENRHRCYSAQTAVCMLTAKWLFML